MFAKIRFKLIKLNLISEFITIKMRSKVNLLIAFLLL